MCDFWDIKQILNSMYLHHINELFSLIIQKKFFTLAMLWLFSSYTFCLFRSN